MAHSIVQPTLPTATVLQVLTAGGGILAEHALIQVGRHSFERNVRGYQSWAQDDQFAAGDGRRIVGERTVDVLIAAADGEVGAQLHALDQALAAAGQLRYEGVSILLAGVRGITATQPIGQGGADIRATITYLPATAVATTAGGQPVLGPL